MACVEKAFVSSKLMILFHTLIGTSIKINKTELDEPCEIMDLGCGPGYTTRLIANRFKESKVLGVDLDEELINQAKSNVEFKNVSFIVGDGTNLKFKSSKFDCIFEILAFHHIPNHFNAIKEVYRVLKKGGKFVTFDIAVKSLNPFFKLIETQPEEFTKKEFIDNLIKAGFKIRRHGGRFIFWVEAVK